MQSPGTPRSPAIELINTMDPPRLPFMMCGIDTLVVNQTPVTLMSISSRNSSALRSQDNFADAAIPRVGDHDVQSAEFLDSGVDR